MLTWGATNSGGCRRWQVRWKRGAASQRTRVVVVVVVVVVEKFRGGRGPQQRVCRCSKVDWIDGRRLTVTVENNQEREEVED